MSSRSRYRSGIVARALLATLASAALLGALVAQPAPSAHAARRLSSATATRPPEAVAAARIALVRVLTYYNGTVSGDNVPIPVLSPCAADGVLVGTTGAGLNGFNYVLTPTAAVNPLSPCQGVRAAFQQLSGNASSWSIGHIDVVLNVAYSGTADAKIGTLVYSIDPAQIATNGGPNAPQVLALALATGVGSPAHDLPVLAVPQPSDAPVDPALDQLLDLTNVTGTPVNRDYVTSSEVRSTLYPIALAAPQAGPTPTQAPASKTPVAGKTPTVAAATPTTATPTTATAVSDTSAISQVGLGAPLIDANGRLVGMVVPDGHGAHMLASVSALTAQIGAVTGKPGPLMTQWQQGLATYYATPPQYGAAATTFDALAKAYPDFAGVAPFSSAARRQSDVIPSLTHADAPQQPTPRLPLPGAPAFMTPRNLEIATISATIAVLVLLALVVLMRRRRAARPASATPGSLADESMLDLLPPNMPLHALPPVAPVPTAADATASARVPSDQEPTIPLPVMTRSSGNGAGDIENVATIKMPAQHHRIAHSRQGAALMPHAAGLTDPGIKRANDPNQDNILAVQGLRITGGRVQPYGFFVVADGMGGHLNGQEASRLTIELLATNVMQMLNTTLALDEATLLHLLRESLHRANVELHRRNLNERLDMGTTVTAALVVDDMAYIANVGDSRIYLMSPETGLRQITQDHSVVASLVSAGVIRPEDVYNHPRRNQIYRSLGGEHEDVEVDTFEVGLQAGDKLLLCSDGLWEMVRDPQIEHILRGSAEPQTAVELLVREANTNGGEDNISALVVRFLEDVPQAAQPELRVLAAPVGAQPQTQG